MKTSTTSQRKSTEKPKKTSAPRRSTAGRAKSAPPSKIPVILESQRQLGGPSYPPTLARLAELTGDTLVAVRKALGSKDLKARVRLSREARTAKAAPEATLVLLAEDLETIARSDRLLLLQVHAARTSSERAFDAKLLSKGLPRPLSAPFKAALEQRIKERRTPPGMGALPGKRPLFFLVADAILPPAEVRQAPVKAEAANDRSSTGDGSFAERFDTAFDALNRASGAQNYVPLAALRTALSDVQRSTFDAELSVLRGRRRYTLDPSDGRHHRMTDAERDAGIMEAGNLLVYVARRSDA